MNHTERARTLLNNIGKLSLGFYPTPLHRLDRISEEYGINLYAKREDFSGMTLFGGNKIRKLEYLLKDAANNGCDTVFTYGATQSNHAMETATAVRKCGMTPVLYLAAIVEPNAADIRANLLLDTILGAEIHILPSNGRNTRDTISSAAPAISEHIARLEKEGHKVYNIPVGGSTPYGACGFADAYIEIMEQAADMGLQPDAVFTATGSGGTLAGLSAGKALLHDDTRLVAIQVGPKDPVSYPAQIADLSNRTLELLGAEERVSVNTFEINTGYYGPGYEVPYKEANDDIRYLARTEGIFTDPVYSGKSFHGMMDYIRSGKIKKGSTVIYLHTGGATALFSESAIIGDLNSLQ
ncbi:MAG: D-cysteine desulfhydrase family protein [Enterocloster sp.]